MRDDFPAERAVGSRDLIGRIGSDEFAILIHGVDTESDLEFQTKKILKIFREPYLINGIVIETTCSIGALLFRYQGRSTRSCSTTCWGAGNSF